MSSTFAVELPRKKRPIWAVDVVELCVPVRMLPSLERLAVTCRLSPDSCNSRFTERRPDSDGPAARTLAEACRGSNPSHRLHHDIRPGTADRVRYNRVTELDRYTSTDVMVIGAGYEPPTYRGCGGGEEPRSCAPALCVSVTSTGYVPRECNRDTPCGGVYRSRRQFEGLLRAGI